MEKKRRRNLKNLTRIWKIMAEFGKSRRYLHFFHWNLKFFTKNCWNWADLAKYH